jgi:hypothetical protein
VYRCAGLHERCFEPFKEERDKTIELYKGLCAKKMWFIPTGDYRMIVAQFLYGVGISKYVFGHMFE